MFYIALGELVVIALAGLVIWQLAQRVLDDSEERTKRMELELLSVLGKTETVALAFNDERPKGSVHYVDDEVMSDLEKQVTR